MISKLTASVFLLFLIVSYAKSPLLIAGDSGWQPLDQAGSKNILETSIPVIVEIDPVVVKPGEKLTIRLVGRIDEEIHLYSINPQGEFAPEPTRLVVRAAFLTPSSETAESKTRLIIDEAFEMPLRVHKNDFWVSRQYRVNSRLVPGKYDINGYLTYQICSQRICSLPLQSNFSETITVLNQKSSND